jgi:SAM-dependent methyltransferase
MTTPKRSVAHLTVLLAAQLLWPGIPHAQGPVAPDLKEAVSKQEAIYQGKEKQFLESYVVDRSLESYAETLPAEFARSLASLGPQDRWLDIGAGEADAILDYYTPRRDGTGANGQPQGENKASAVALSIEDRRSARWHQTAARLEAGKLRYVFGRYFREYPAQELGHFQLITDLFGGFSYTTNLDRYMEKALHALVPGGNLYTVLQDVHAEAGGNKPYYEGSPYLTELTHTDGSELRVCAWLKAISCVQVSCELRLEWKPPIEVYRVQKTCGDVSVPALLPLHFAPGIPPERRFALKNLLPVPREAAR